MKLGERFDSLERTRTPELWGEIEQREPRTTVDVGPSPLRRVGIALLALAIAAAGFMFVVGTFIGRGSLMPGRSLSPLTLVPRANGALYFQVGGADGPIEAASIDGSGYRLAIASDPSLQRDQVAFSPDGEQIAFVSHLPGTEGIWTAKADGSAATRITDGVNDGYPSWSPDGTRIAFSSTRADPAVGDCGSSGEFLCPTDIYMMSVDGSGVTRLTDSPEPESQAAWSPDGSKIAFVRNVGTGSAIFVVNADGTGLQQLTESTFGVALHPSWSSDGTQLAFTSFHEEDWGIGVVNADGTRQQDILFGVGTYAVDPVWAPDGSWIAFHGIVSSNSALEVMRPNGTDVTVLAEPPGAEVTGIAWQPLLAASGSPSPPQPTLAARVTDTIDVGRAVSSVTYGEGSVWVAVSNNDGSYGGHILRIDPDTSKTIADIPVDTVPTWEVGGGGLTVGDGSVWIAGAMNGEGTLNSPGGGSDALLLRIDAATDRVVDRIPLGGLFGADVAVDDSGVWVMIFGTGNQMEVDRIDPATDQVVATIPLDSTYGHFIFATGGDVIAATNATHNSTVGNTILNIIDPATNSVTAKTPLDRYGWAAASSDAIYAAMVNAIVRLDPATGELVRTYSGVAGTGDALSVGEGGVWFFSPNDRSAVHRLNTDTGEVDVSVDLPGKLTPIAMTTSPGAVWVLDYEGKLVKVSLT